MIEIAQNKFNETEVSAFITVFMMRSITLEEMQGFREALLDLAVKVDLGTHDLVDIVGTGGDGKTPSIFLLWQVLSLPEPDKK